MTAQLRNALGGVIQLSLIVVCTVAGIAVTDTTYAESRDLGFQEPLVCSNMIYAITVDSPPEIVAVEIGKNDSPAWRTSLPKGVYGQPYTGLGRDLLLPRGGGGFTIVNRDSGRIVGSGERRGELMGVATNGDVFFVDPIETTIRCYNYPGDKVVWETALGPDRRLTRMKLCGGVVLVTIAPASISEDTNGVAMTWACLSSKTGDLVWQKSLPVQDDGWPLWPETTVSDRYILSFEGRNIWLLDRDAGSIIASASKAYDIDVAQFWDEERAVIGYRRPGSRDAVIEISKLPHLSPDETFYVKSVDKEPHSWGLFGNTLCWGRCLVDLRSLKETHVYPVSTHFRISYQRPHIRDMLLYFGSGDPKAGTRVIGTRNLKTGEVNVIYEEQTEQPIRPVE